MLNKSYEQEVSAYARRIEKKKKAIFWRYDR